MIEDTHKTIDAYLKAAGLRSGSSVTSKNFIPLKARSRSNFVDLMDRMASADVSTDPTKSAGLSIADYLKQRKANSSPSMVFNTTFKNGFFANNYKYQIDADQTGSMGDTSGNDVVGTTNTATRNPTTEKNQINRSIQNAAKKYDLPAKLIHSMIQAESGFQPDAVSPVGAQGLMQLMPATARDLGVNDPFDVEQNIDGGAKYIRQMLDRFDGDIKLALAAYNAGPGTVARYNGDVPYRETRQYVQRVLSGMTSGKSTLA